jgi:hypothetical protein
MGNIRLDLSVQLKQISLQMLCLPRTHQTLLPCTLHAVFFLSCVQRFSPLTTAVFRCKPYLGIVEGWPWRERKHHNTRVWQDLTCCRYVGIFNSPWRCHAEQNVHLSHPQTTLKPLLSSINHYRYKNAQKPSLPWWLNCAAFRGWQIRSINTLIDRRKGFF